MDWARFWLDRYRSHLRLAPGEPLPPGREPLVAFLRSLRDAGKPAWQWLQAVRAVRAALPPEASTRLGEVERTLERLAHEQSRKSSEGTGEPGPVDPNEPPIVQRLRAQVRVRHLALATEKAYVKWIVRFMAHNGLSPQSDSSICSADRWT